MKKEEARKLLSLPFDKLIAEADRVRREHIGNNIELCGIVNAKSGSCPEDCRFCAQSAHHSAEITTYPLKDKDAMVSAARDAKCNGAVNFGIVTSGNRLTRGEIDVVADAVGEIEREVGIAVCASLGALDRKAFLILKEAGLKRYHHNIETSSRYYPSIVSTHDYDERVNTVKMAKGAGLEVCSGGIIGMGEDWDDRIEMALLLKELSVDSVPVNILVPIKGTAFEDRETLSPLDAIRTIAIFRVILKDKTIKVAAGRESVLKDFAALMYMAGANGMLIGGYLTVAGRAVEEDLELVGQVTNIWNGR